ncbi:biotin apo-protein ligase [Mycobacterium haemophilum DSM 44634]|uniref:biotin--[biotin carboxyl-carrier protein] ligase n=2 Tax=Mycobacterium haemophilum TaxID=29311 RepID=A0A0I9V2I5_9MYCO|nr:biotin--acetyl-CoA-carboxylase ligase [Mycobacterium haemophilum DSM 44634]KLO33636.1 biotin--acetyl-CoA-carboxylase ligase [Mycobacterium haemophilum]KLO39164.1 biotin--acetyl-CoA-carboxylase ligase [Mycobacterium haemophilum]KLO41752.1 biotin--acetyl-CoA-carboxylase ligase [Mycobacterium haemophilum]KLO49781.1 biotin--acetyl-CoA-carboxylase ligase [Mycobacterium haemophilum]
MDRDLLRPPLDPAALRAELIGTGLRWRQLDVVAQTGSTNADLLARAASGIDIDGAVLIAEHQTAGRGRHGRGWSASPRAQITMSIGVSVADVPVAAWGWLSLATGVAVLDTVAPMLDVTGVDAGLKWPNDVVASGGKLAGILAEVAQPAIVVGVGLNVTQAPEEVDGPGATSLLDLGVPAPDREQLVRRLLRELDARVGQWRRADPQLMADYRARSLTLGSRVRAELPGGTDVVGTARGIDDQGRLCLETGRETEGAAEGQTVVISAGDVVHLR